MLVFRASQHVAGARNDSLSVRKRARLLSSSSASSKRAARKTVALELNRINPAKFQTQPQAATPSMMAQSYDQLVADSSTGKGGRALAVDSQSSRRNSSSTSVENSVQKVAHVNGHSSSVATYEKSSGRLNWSDCNHNQEEDDSSTETDSEANCGAARTKGLFKKPETREIGVMTDLCGIDSVLDLSPVGSNSTTSSNRKGLTNMRLSLQPCPSLKKGCTDRCTSPGFPSKHQPFRNGSVNGFTFNGYASPDVLKLRAGPGIYQQNKKKAALSLLRNHTDQQIGSVLALERNGVQEASMTHKDPETGEIRPRSEFQAAASLDDVTNDDGELPFKVSIPRTVLNSSSNGDDGCKDGGVTEPCAATTAGGAAVGSEEPMQVQTSINDTNKKGSTQSSSAVTQQQKSPSSTSTYKRRSEIQLLLDGDKPPSERISASEVPIFTAEDLSSRNARNTGGGGSGSGGQLNRPWLDSSTRKITPVDHFDYAFVSLTEKVTGIVHSSSGGGGSVSGVSGSVASSSRKRNMSDSDGGGPPSMTPSSGQGGAASGTAPPPTKQAKMVNNSSSANSSNVEEDRRLDGVGPSSESVTSPTLGSNAQDTTTANTSKAIASCDSNSSLDSESLNVAKSGGVVDKNSLFQSDDVFASELVVFDSRGDCLLNEGEYSILMQRCSKKGEVPGLLTFAPLTWSSVFAGGCTDSKVGY